MAPQHLPEVELEAPGLDTLMQSCTSSQPDYASPGNPGGGGGIKSTTKFSRMTMHCVTSRALQPTPDSVLLSYGGALPKSFCSFKKCAKNWANMGLKETRTKKGRRAQEG